MNNSKFRNSTSKELQGKEAEEWFKHSTLEASENLLNSLRQTSQEHQQNMSDLAAMLQKMDALQQYLNKIKKEEISVSKLSPIGKNHKAIGTGVG